MSQAYCSIFRLYDTMRSFSMCLKTDGPNVRLRQTSRSIEPLGRLWQTSRGGNNGYYSKNPQKEYSLQECRRVISKYFKNFYVDFCKCFWCSVLCEASCLHYLLPEERDSSVTDRLHHAKTFEHIPARTKKFQNSFIPYCF